MWHFTTERSHKSQDFRVINEKIQSVEWNPCGDEWRYAASWARQFTELAANDEKRDISQCLQNITRNLQCESRKKSRSKKATQTKMHSKLARVKINSINDSVGRKVSP